MNESKYSNIWYLPMTTTHEACFGNKKYEWIMSPVYNYILFKYYHQLLSSSSLTSPFTTWYSNSWGWFYWQETAPRALLFFLFICLFFFFFSHLFVKFCSLNFQGFKDSPLLWYMDKYIAWKRKFEDLDFTFSFHVTRTNFFGLKSCFCYKEGTFAAEERGDKLVKTYLNFGILTCTLQFRISEIGKNNLKPIAKPAAHQLTSP